VLVFGLTDEDVNRVLAFRREQGVTFPLLLGQDTYRSYQDPGSGPYALDVVLDRRGIVRFVAHGASTESLRGQIDALLAEP
jgi:hypothetical protein